MPAEEGQALTAIRLPGSSTSLQQLGANARVEIVDQLLLPVRAVQSVAITDTVKGVIKWIEVSDSKGAFDAIKSMQIRGAPAIASLAALGIACELLRQSKPDVSKQVIKMTDYLITSRPTAVNLAEALGRIRKAASAGGDDEAIRQRVIQICVQVWEEDIERCQRIGDNGAKWILERLESTGAIAKGGKAVILTVCNTGSLATSGYGTALGIITSLHKLGRLEHCFFAQTAPYNQGARLTSLELLSLGIPSTMVLDSAMASLLQGNAGLVPHAFVAGADRVAANGDTANKLSTAQISFLCHAVPAKHRPLVVVAAPITTLDLSMDDGSSITIEQRPEIEAKTARGLRYPAGDKPEHVTVLITPTDMQVWNPAFDITPARLIDGIATEVGTAEPPSPGSAFDLRSYVKSNVQS